MTKLSTAAHLRSRLFGEITDQRINSRIDGICFIIGLIISVLLLVLAVRSAVRLEMSYDAPIYY